MSENQFPKLGAGNTAALSMRGVCGFLRAALPHSTAKQVAHVAGVPAKTVEKWLNGETRPSGAHLAALISVFGPPFVAAAMPKADWAREASHDAAILAAAEQLTQAIRRRLAA